MNFDVYIFGTPNGYNQFPDDGKSRLFQTYARNSKTDSQLTIYRDEQLVYYVYQRRIASDNANNFLGFCIVFNGIYCKNTQKLFALFDRTYNDVMLKGEFLRFDKSGKVSFIIEKFTEKEVEIERIKKFFHFNINSEFNKDFVPILSSFRVGNGTKTLSVKDNNTDIDTAIRQFDCVCVSNNEKSVSELERVYRMYTKLETEKQNLTTQYNKLLGQKKQYKVVFFLCLLIIGCAIGLFVFNKNLQSRDSKIQSLEINILEKNDTISNQRSNIEQLNFTQQKLNNEIADLHKTIRQKNIAIDEKNEEIQYLTSKNRSLLSENSKLDSQNDRYKGENSTLQTRNKNLLADIERYKTDVERCKSNNKKRPNSFYVEKVDCSDYSFKLTLYYDDGTSKSSGWYYRNKSYTLD